MNLLRVGRRAALLKVAALAGLQCPYLHAQEELFHWDGASPSNGMGHSIALLPDVTGDGVPDLLVGEMNGDCSLQDEGATHVISGSDGTTWITQCGSGGAFGWATDQLDDLDGDGISDYVVGELAYDSSLGPNAGRVCVYSGNSGSLIYTLEGEEQQNAFGVSTAGIGDIDGDGRGDFIVGAYNYAYFSPPSIGRCYVYSGATGTLIRSHDGEQAYDQFGWNASGLGDVDADGIGDYGVMANYDPLGVFGAVYVYSGATGTQLYKWVGGAYYRLGEGMAGHLDWDGDGFGDILVGAPVNLYSDGFVYIFSGKDGSTLATATGETYGTQFGFSVANVGDMNGDGWPEILVGEPLNNELHRAAGRATLLSGRTLRRLYHFYGAGTGTTQFGLRSSGGLDYNSDGIPDLVVSEPNGGGKDPKGGRVHLFAGNDLFLQAIADVVTAADSLVLDTRGGDTGALSMLVIRDINGTPLFLPIQIATLDANGEMELAATVPSGLAGTTITFQSFAQKPGAKHGYVDSGLEVLSIY